MDWDLTGALFWAPCWAPFWGPLWAWQARLGWRGVQPLLQPRQGPVLSLFGVAGFAKGAAEALVAIPARHLHHQAAPFGMDELDLELHGVGIVPGLGEGFLEWPLRLCCRTNGSAGDPHDYAPD